MMVRSNALRSTVTGLLLLFSGNMQSNTQISEIYLGKAAADGLSARWFEKHMNIPTQETRGLLVVCL